MPTVFKVEDTTLLPRIFTVAKQFEGESSFVRGEMGQFVKTYTDFIRHGYGAVFVLADQGEPVGMLGCLKFPDLHTGAMTAVETIWFVLPDHRGCGLKLLDAFEQWGAAEGCEVLAMIHMLDSHPEALGKLYRRRGYKPIETHYVKTIRKD